MSRIARLRQGFGGGGEPKVERGRRQNKEREREGGAWEKRALKGGKFFNYVTLINH